MKGKGSGTLLWVPAGPSVQLCVPLYRAIKGVNAPEHSPFELFSVIPGSFNCFPHISGPKNRGEALSEVSPAKQGGGSSEPLAVPCGSDGSLLVLCAGTAQLSDP